MQIDLEKAPQSVSWYSLAKTWLLHEDAPKVEKPVVIQNLHENPKHMGFAIIGDEEKAMPEKLVEVKDVRLVKEARNLLLSTR